MDKSTYAVSFLQRCLFLSLFLRSVESRDVSSRSLPLFCKQHIYVAHRRDATQFFMKLRTQEKRRTEVSDKQTGDSLTRDSFVSKNS